MKVYKVKDLANFEKDNYGQLICPSGDYTNIKSFRSQCAFGDSCLFGNSSTFGEYCSFGKFCSFGAGCNLDNKLHFENIAEDVDQVLKIYRIGSRKGCTYFFKTLSNIYVRCGCFFGTIYGFKKIVKIAYKDNPQYLLEYTEAIKHAKKILKYKELDNE